MGYWVFTLAKIIAMLFLAVLHSSKIAFWFSKGEGRRPSFRGGKWEMSKRVSKDFHAGDPHPTNLGGGEINQSNGGKRRVPRHHFVKSEAIQTHTTWALEGQSFKSSFS